MQQSVTNTFIFFRNFVVLASIGIHDEEKVKPQRVFLNVKLFIDNTPDEMQDSILDTLDYDIIRRDIKKLASSQHFNLQETLCEEIAKYCLTHDPVVMVEISSEKPDVYDDCDAVGLKIIRFRDTNDDKHKKV